MKTISQSLIRDMLKPEGFCGYYLNEVYNEGFRTSPTEAMVNGLFFEQDILGRTRDGELVELPKSKTNGAKLKREIDLEFDIKFARSVLEKNKILFDEKQVYYETPFMHGHLDAVGTYTGKRYIFDLKWTGMSFDQWEREWKWSDISAHFKLQARQYQAIYPDALPFMFLVFGSDWCRFFEIAYEPEEVAHHTDIAAEALKTFNTLDFRATTDSRLCFDCRLKNICPVRNWDINIEEID
jgi:hypothetical protein